MPPKSPGRPKTSNPRCVKVTVQFTHEEAAQLRRLAGPGTLSEAIRACIHWYLTHPVSLPDAEGMPAPTTEGTLSLEFHHDATGATIKVVQLPTTMQVMQQCLTLLQDLRFVP